MMVGTVCGSLGLRSANAAILNAAAAHLEHAGHTVRGIEFLSEIPTFDPRLVDDAPSSVDEFRRALRSSDALLLAAPEYAAGVAGAVKNALDWLVGDATIYRKVIGVASAGTTGGPNAIEQLVRTISWQGGWVVATVGVAAARTKTDTHGNYTDRATLTEIECWTDAVTAAVDGPTSLRLNSLTQVVSRFGIDPTRFGDLDEPSPGLSMRGQAGQV